MSLLAPFLEVLLWAPVPAAMTSGTTRRTWETLSAFRPSPSPSTFARLPPKWGLAGSIRIAGPGGRRFFFGALVIKLPIAMDPPI